MNPETDGDDGGLFDESRWSVIYRKHQEIQKVHMEIRKVNIL